MINFLKSALVILLTFTLTDIYGQLRSEYLIGVNLSTLTIKIKGVNINPNTSVGIHFGGFYEIPIRKHFALQPSFIFSAKVSLFSGPILHTHSEDTSQKPEVRLKILAMDREKVMI